MPRPYRLGTSSFIFPDAVLPNVQRLASRVDDIEILFFDLSDPGALPDASELEALAALKAEHGLTYSLHTPLDASLASADDRRREAGVAQVLKSIELARPLRPENFIVHVYRGDREGEAMPDAPRAWRDRAMQSFESILDGGVPPHRLCVEWLDYDLALLEPVIEALGLSVALDVGHLYRDGIELKPVLDRFLERCRVIHWHGTGPQGRDHRSLDCFPGPQGRAMLARLDEAGWSGVLTLEVFNETDFERSLSRFKVLSAEVSTCRI